ncbi:class I SAM-dependent methyltransferase [Gryllotalpicola daejeonensis]|uniref:Class I SAM-dependent methyltransferase n=1 Tax=Gryllotalpicola daejeonensis TaxID=993087 RepID=A0ABP7ZI18_9MICO
MVSDTPEARPSKEEHARSFDAAARIYEESRPGYPAEAVEWLVPASARRVLDVGAGTGKFTRLLPRAGRDLVAVDPSAQMLEVLREKVPRVETLLGSAERLPLSDESVDAVTVAQAWHWVDTAQAVREVARVLKPGGTLGLIWNSRDERVDWVREFGEAMESNDAFVAKTAEDHGVGAPFEPGETLEVTWTQQLDRAALLTLVRSRSHFLVKDSATQTRVLCAVEDVLDSHPEIEKNGKIALPYVTQAFRYRRG